MNEYTLNENQQILLSLLKEYRIRKVVVSPGGTNPALVASMQYDGGFELYSCVDERSAAYMACGMAVESGEPVAICCTGATSSRNYMPALTEAFYRKIPIIAITCSRDSINIGNLIPQVTDRTKYPGDIIVDGAQLQIIKDESDRWDVEYKINRVLQSALHKGGGPVHFNILCGTQDCGAHRLPEVNVIRRISKDDPVPDVPHGNVAIFIGSHKRFCQDEIEVIDKFCESYNGVVFYDHTSLYTGKYGILYSLIGTQVGHKFHFSEVDLLIHIGEVSGDYKTTNYLLGKETWRISEDGQIRITFKKLNYIFEMKEYEFFKKMVALKTVVVPQMFFYNTCRQTYNEIYNNIPELPFSNIWIAKTLAPKMPKYSIIHLAILNSLRSWNFFEVDKSINTYCNVGGFGIDGCVSTLIGASLVHQEKLYFCITGDLAFFYDLNSLGNRHIGNNIRILLINNGTGAEFKHFQANNYEVGIDAYIAASGHFGNKSKTFVHNIATSLGFKYLFAEDKEGFKHAMQEFVDAKMTDKPMVFEVFTDSKNQSDAWEKLSNIAIPDAVESLKHSKFGKFVKSIVK